MKKVFITISKDRIRTISLGISMGFLHFLVAHSTYAHRFFDLLRELKIIKIKHIILIHLSILEIVIEFRVIPVNILPFLAGG